MGMRQLRISNSITNRESESLEKYLQEISRLEMITPDEEVELSNRIKKGDRNALNRLTKANLRFVVSVAKQYQGQGLSLPDLINEGNLGLIKAASKFDNTKGFKFISFAVWWIRQNILQAIAENSRLIRLPINKVSLNQRIYRAQSLLEQQLERMPTTEEIADVVEMAPEEIADSINHSQRTVSLDNPLSSEEDSLMIDVIINPNAEATDARLYYQDSLRREIARCFGILSVRQKEVLCYYFGIGVDYPMSLDDIASKYNITTERVRQIKDKAIDKLRAMQNFNALRGFLGN